MSDSKLEVKACPWCQQQPIKRTDSYIPDAVACPNGHTAPMRLSEWNNRPIANNGVSLEEFRMHVLNVLKKRFPHVGEKSYENIKDAQDEILVKLQPTAINNGVSVDSIVDKLTHLNGDHLMGLELNDIHIIANFITRLQTTAPRGGQ